jgi:arylsulfatase A-like enzyme
MSKPNKFPLNRRQFARLSLGAAAAGMSGPLWAKKAQKRPNILFIMADDLGYGDLSCFGRPDYKTPVLDQLAADGVKLTHTYANSSVCSPTRTALLTGQYQYRFRAGLDEPIANVNRGIAPDVPTLANIFRDAGYHTALTGKWHLGAAPDFGPIKNGYEHFFGFYPGGVEYFAHKFLHGKFRPFAGPERDGLWRDDKEPVERDGYLTDIIADEAQDYIEAFAKTDDPFMLSLHFSAPHWPWVGPNDVRRARDLTTIFDNDGGNAAVYGEMVKSLDANVGRVLAKLEATGQAENTIVIFTSDNGGERFSYNWPFLGKKGELLEGGIRVPGIVRWPAAIKAGQTSEQVVTSMDWLPTLMAASGIEQTTDFDGENMLPFLLDSDKTRERELFWRFKANDQVAVRSGRWKYLKLKDSEYLFDIVTDEREQANLIKVQPDIAKRLKAQYAAWNETMLPYPEDSWSHAANDFYTDRY